nr:MAG TPA: hypothetical protein [Caudoviricetes sp.]
MKYNCFVELVPLCRIYKTENCLYIWLFLL